MAHVLLASYCIKIPFSVTSSRNHYRYKIGSFQCNTVALKLPRETHLRRSANYQPTIWDYDYLQSLGSEFLGESYRKRIDKLKGEVRAMLISHTNSLDQLELIDTLQRLGLGYCFQEDINRILVNLFSNDFNYELMNLHATALRFRLSRQHGFHIPQEIFNSFKDDEGKFKEELCKNMEGLLSLYEASYLCEEGESILEDATKFSTEYLRKYVEEEENEKSYVCMLIKHALEMPLHWRVERWEARWFIDVYAKKEGMNPLLLELAKLDFNFVQAVHQQDVKQVSRWWKDTRIEENLSFARDRLVQNFLWTVGNQYEVEYSYGRKVLTKVNSLITVIDDIYDVYGKLDELELFTLAIQRWDVNVTIPDYMKICFSELDNLVNEIGLHFLKKQGFDIIPHLKKSWAELCKYYLMEAQWYYSGYKPSLEEYLERAWISITTPLTVLNYLCVSTTPVTEEALEYFMQYPNIIRLASVISRLANDLGTSYNEMKRGDIPKAVQCYMHETGASEEEARQHITNLIKEAWTKINKERLQVHPLTQSCIERAINMARNSQYMYHSGDGHAVEDSVSTHRILSFLVHPIPL